MNGRRREIMRGKSHSLPQYAHTIRLYTALIRFYNNTLTQQYDSIFRFSSYARTPAHNARNGGEWGKWEEMGRGEVGEQFPLGG